MRDFHSADTHNIIPMWASSVYRTRWCADSARFCCLTANTPSVLYIYAPVSLGSRTFSDPDKRNDVRNEVFPWLKFCSSGQINFASRGGGLGEYVLKNGREEHPGIIKPAPGLRKQSTAENDFRVKQFSSASKESGRNYLRARLRHFPPIWCRPRWALLHLCSALAHLHLVLLPAMPFLSADAKCKGVLSTIVIWCAPSW